MPKTVQMSVAISEVAAATTAAEATPLTVADVPAVVAARVAAAEAIDEAGPEDAS